MISRWIKLENSNSCLLIGPRRAGKTTLLRGRFPDFDYFSLDDYDLLTLAKEDPKRLCALGGRSVIIDEVQRVPELLIAIKHMIDSEKKIFLMTGSSSLGLVSSGAETLAGRIILRECPTFCWGEEIGPPTHRTLAPSSDALQVKQAARDLESAVVCGGFPEVVTAKTEKEKTEVLRNYKNTYFTKDLLLISNIENADGLLAILNYLAISLGSHLEVSNASNESGVSYPTTKKYLNVLKESRLVFKLYGYQYGPAKRYTKAAKYYFSDPGIVTALGTRISQGQRLENFVIAEIEKRRQLGVFNCDQLFYYKSVGGSEIDLVIEEPQQLTAIEIKLTKKPRPSDTRQLREFLKQQVIHKEKVMGYLIHCGEEVGVHEGIHLLPVTHLFRAQ